MLLRLPLAILFAAAALAAQSGSSSDATSIPGSGPRIVLEALDGTMTLRAADAAPLTSMKQGGAAFARFVDVGQAVSKDKQKISARNLASLELAGGDRLAGAVRGGDGDFLLLELTGGVELRLSIDSIRSIVFAARIPTSVTTAPTAGEDGDRLYLVAAGSLDRATGFVEQFTGDGITFEDERVGARTFDWSKVAALFINPLEEGGRRRPTHRAATKSPFPSPVAGV